jgi:hypothetical protein
VVERRLTPGGWRTVSRSPLPPRPSPSPRGGA